MGVHPQLNKNGELQHLLTTEGLPAVILRHILDTAESFTGVTERDVKKIPLLRGKSVFNLFFEPSTRTRTTFEIAAKTPFGGCDQSQYGSFISDQGRNVAGYGG